MTNRRTSRKHKSKPRRTSLRRNSSLTQKAANASAMALISRIEKAVGSGDYGVASAALDRLSEWKRRYGAWPFDAKRYWHAVDEMQRGVLAAQERRQSEGRGLYQNPSSTSQKKALRNLWEWSTGSDRTGNPYAKSPVREAIRALGDSEGYDLPAKRPSGKIAGALYDLAKWATGGDRTGNPYSKPVVRAACKALGGNGYDLPVKLRKNSRSLRRNSADWSTRTAVAAKARAAFARGDGRAARRYLAELSVIDLAMMPRAMRRNPPIVFSAETQALARQVYEAQKQAAPRKWTPVNANRTSRRTRTTKSRRRTSHR